MPSPLFKHTLNLRDPFVPWSKITGAPGPIRTGTSAYVQVGVNTTASGLLWAYTLPATSNANYRIHCFGNSARVAGTPTWQLNIGAVVGFLLSDPTLVAGVWSMDVQIRVLSATNVQCFTHFMHAGAPGTTPVATDRNLLSAASPLNPAGPITLGLFGQFSVASVSNAIDCWQSQLEAY